jgi:sn-glycerol 3-phosphate transport system ATP-binding protein
MDVSSNMGFSLLLKKAEKTTIDGRVGAAAKRLGLDSFLGRLPRQLSGGQRQRVAMGRAIVREPAAFLFDEPLSNLDAKLRVQMRVEIRRLQRSLGTTSVYVTHDQMEAMTLADRLVVLNNGRIEQVGTPIELYERPATTFVATFIGSPSMNLLEIASNSTTPAAISAPPNAATIGIRPENLRLAKTEQQADFTAEVHVSAVELVGAESYVHGTLPNKQDIVFRVPGRSPISIDERLSIAADLEDLHFFDQEGCRIITACRSIDRTKTDLPR